MRRVPGPEERHYQAARLAKSQRDVQAQVHVTECQRQLDVILEQLPGSKDYESCLVNAAHDNVVHGKNHFTCYLWRHLYDGKCDYRQNKLDMPSNVMLATDPRAQANDHVTVVVSIETKD
jgi:hypothetical protein